MIVRALFAALTLPVLVLAADPADPDAPDYETLDRAGEPLVSAFNNDAGKVRLVMYVAATCGGCLRGADGAQEDVLAEIESDDLAAYVVWVRKNGARERHVDRVLGLVTDSRATQYWDESAAMVPRFDGLLDIEGGPCAGAFLVYGPDARWDGETPPKPDYWQDAHPELDRSDVPSFDGDELAAVVREHLPK